jgi:hypothetical protein
MLRIMRAAIRGTKAVFIAPGLPTVGAVLELVVQYILGYNAGYAC